MPVPTGSSNFLKNKFKITNVCFVRHGSAPRSQELRSFPGGAALCRGVPGPSPLAAVPPVPPSGPFTRAPRPPSAQKPRVCPAKPRPETVGNGAVGPQSTWEEETRGRRARSFCRGQPVPGGSGARPRWGDRRFPRTRPRYREAAAEQTRGFLGYRRRHGASSAAPRGKSPRQADGRRRAGSSRLPPPAIPHLPWAAAGPGRRQVALGTTHLNYKSLPFGLKVTNWVANNARARPQFAMATPEPPRVPTRVRGTP